MKSSKKFTGLFTAIITPFNNYAIDYESLEKILEEQIQAGVSGVVVCGTTGESPTLSHDEHNALVSFVIKFCKGKIKVIAGTGSNSTVETVSLTKHAEDSGADASLIVLPYYNKPTQDGLYLHYKHVSQNTSLPIIIYNVPGRSVVNITDETISRIANDCKNVVGIKDATGDLMRVCSLRSTIGHDFSLLSGEDGTALAFNASGGDGCISVTSNVIPAKVNELQKLSLSGNINDSLKLQDYLTPIHEAMFYETNPIPVKYAMYLRNMCKLEYRLPLCCPSIKTQERIKLVLNNAGII